MKLTDMVITAMIKKGILYEARNVNVDFTVPRDKAFDMDPIRINFKADHMSIRIEKDGGA